MGPWNLNRGQWNVNRELEQWAVECDYVTCNVIMGPRNVIMGPWNMNRVSWNLNT